MIANDPSVLVIGGVTAATAPDGYLDNSTAATLTESSTWYIWSAANSTDGVDLIDIEWLRKAEQYRQSRAWSPAPYKIVVTEDPPHMPARTWPRHRQSGWTVKNFHRKRE